MGRVVDGADPSEVELAPLEGVEPLPPAIVLAATPEGEDRPGNRWLLAQPPSMGPSALFTARRVPLGVACTPVKGRAGVESP